MTREQLLQALKIGRQHFADMLRFRNADETIRLAFKLFPHNADIRHVTLKAVLINTLYGTAIFDVAKMAQHIVGCKIDTKIERTDLSVVDDLRLGHGIGKGSIERNLYSFATKYAHFHKPQAYPMFDNLVKQLLPELNQVLHFGPHFTQEQLLNYSSYRNTIDSLISFLHCRWGYKSFDEGLWVLARYKKEKDSGQTRIPSEVFAQLQSLIGDFREQGAEG